MTRSNTRPRTRGEAIAQGESQYSTGQPCRNGHTTYRYTRNGECAACRADRNAEGRRVFKAALERRQALEANA